VSQRRRPKKSMPGPQGAKMKRNVFCKTFSLVLISLLLLTVSLPGKTRAEVIQAKKIFTISDLKPAPSCHFTFMPNCFDIDKKGNYYFVVSKRHGVLKYSPNGDFISQIGSIGKGEKDLYYPGIISIHNDMLYVSEGGKRIKRFSLDGNYISSFEIKHGKELSTIRVNDEKIYTDVRYYVKNFSHKKLISVFTREGELEAEIGKGPEVKAAASYWAFNSTFFHILNNHIYGTFQFSPVIFKYDFDGKQVFYKDLSKMGIPEIDRITEEVIGKGSDLPGNKKTKQTNTVMVIRYCTGFCIDSHGNFYYGIRLRGQANCILILNSKGTLHQKIILTYNDKIIKPSALYFKNNKHYCIGYIKSYADESLFTFAPNKQIK
jgi:hypothetical protein